jgi:hypothetical protein
MGIELLDDAMIARTRTILKLSDSDFSPENVEFLSDTEGRDTALHLDRDVWRELGKPKTITVVIEAGDKLND